MGKAETASRNKINQARPQVRPALALRIAVNRVFQWRRNSGSFAAVLLGIAVAASACAARDQGLRGRKYGRRAAVPGCAAQVYVAKGCYAQSFPDHLEVR